MKALESLDEMVWRASHGLGERINARYGPWGKYALSTASWFASVAFAVGAREWVPRKVVRGVCFIGVPDLVSKLSGIPGTPSSADTMAHPLETLLTTYKRAVRLPIALAGTVVVGAGAYQALSSLAQGEPIPAETLPKLSFGMQMLSSASSMYLHDPEEPPPSKKRMRYILRPAYLRAPTRYSRKPLKPPRDP